MDALHSSQQTALKQLGYYDGEVDGIWGPMTIQAKIKFERSGQFAPGLPSNGMPFIKGHMLPFQLRWEGDSLVVTDKFAAANPATESIAPVVVKAAPVVTAPVVETKVEAPVVETKVEAPKVEEPAAPVVEAATHNVVHKTHPTGGKAPKQGGKKGQVAGDAA